MNIDRFRVKELKDFVLPIKDIAVVFNAWPNVTSVVPLTLESSGGVEVGVVNGEIETTLHNGVVVDWLKVVNIFLRGANSGAAYEDFLGLLRKSFGRMVAVLVWDDGEKITRLTVEEGVVTEDVIDV